MAYTIGGEGWYRKRFNLPDLRPDDRVELRFDGVYCRSEMWINGKYLGYHPNGYTVFAFDLTPHLKRDAENVIAVRVRNVGATSRWYSGSGIYRPTWLTVTGPVRVPMWGVGIDTPEVSEQRARVRTKVDVVNSRDREILLQVRNVVRGPDGKAVATRTSKRRKVKAGDSTTYTFYQRVPRPALWSLESPNLYTARTEVLIDGRVVDRVTETFGIRSIVFSDKGFFLNGRSVEMRGGNVHHDHGPLGAMSLDRSEERRVQILKAAGFNAIRSSHNAPNPALLAACDRLGVLFYDECFDTWSVPKTSDNDYGKDFAEHWQRDVTSWVLEGRNRPCVVIRSLGNEILAGSPEQGAAMAKLVKSLDPTRPICQGGGQGIWVIPSGDSSAADAYTDVGDIHYQHSYGSKPDANPGKAWLQSESYAATIYEDWKLVTDHPYAVGDFVWTSWDHLGESGIGVTQVLPIGASEAENDDVSAAVGVFGATGPYPYYGASCGDFDLIGQPKPQLRYRQVVWGDRPLELMVERPTLPGQEQRRLGWAWYDELESWTWDVTAGQLMKVRVYTSGDSVKLLLNGTQVGSAQLSEGDKRIASFRVAYAPGELTAVALRGGQEIARKTIATVGKPAALRITSDVDKLTTSRDALAHALVEVIDAHGRVVPDAVVKVNFVVKGGQLAAVGNGNSHNVDSFQRPRRWSYRGQVMAYLRSPQQPGTVTLTATADGLQPATRAIPAVAPPTRVKKKPAKKKSKKKKKRAVKRTESAAVFSAPVVLLAVAFSKLAERRERFSRAEGEA